MSFKIELEPDGTIIFLINNNYEDVVEVKNNGDVIGCNEDEKDKYLELANDFLEEENNLKPDPDFKGNYYDYYGINPNMFI